MTNIWRAYMLDTEALDNYEANWQRMQRVVDAFIARGYVVLKEDSEHNNHPLVVVGGREGDAERDLEVILASDGGKWEGSRSPIVASVHFSQLESGKEV